MDADRLLWVLTPKNFYSIYFAKIELFFNFEIKCSLSRIVFICFTIFQILKRKFYEL